MHCYKLYFGLFISHVAALKRLGLLLQAEFLFVLSVCLLTTVMYSGKTADWIDMPFWVVGWLGPGNQILDGGPGANFGEMGSAV